MRKRAKTQILASLLFLSYGLPLCAFPQAQEPESSKQDKNRKITVETRLSQDGVLADSVIMAALILNIQPGWHINTANPSDENMIGTSAEISHKPGVELVSISYPQGIKRKFSFSNEPIEVYDGTQILYLKFRLSPDAHPGLIELPVDISYQACNNVLCLAPATQRVTIAINVVPPATPVSKLDEQLFEGMLNH